MKARELIAYLEEYDGDSEVEVDVLVAETGDCALPTFAVSAFSADELASGLQSDHPTVRAGVSLGLMTASELEALASLAPGPDR